MGAGEINPERIRNQEISNQTPPSTEVSKTKPPKRSIFDKVPLGIALAFLPHLAIFDATIGNPRAKRAYIEQRIDQKQLVSSVMESKKALVAVDEDAKGTKIEKYRQACKEGLGNIDKNASDSSNCYEREKNKLDDSVKTRFEKKVKEAEKEFLKEKQNKVSGKNTGLELFDHEPLPKSLSTNEKIQCRIYAIDQLLVHSVKTEDENPFQKDLDEKDKKILNEMKLLSDNLLHMSEKSKTLKDELKATRVSTVKDVVKGAIFGLSMLFVAPVWLPFTILFSPAGLLELAFAKVDTAKILEKKLGDRVQTGLEPPEVKTQSVAKTIPQTIQESPHKMHTWKPAVKPEKLTNVAETKKPAKEPDVVEEDLDDLENFRKRIEERWVQADPQNAEEE